MFGRLSPRPENARSNAGFSLLEVLVAIAVLAIGTLAVMRTLDQAGRVVAEAPARFLAQTVATNRAEELRIWGAQRARGLPQAVTAGPYEWRIESRVRKTEVGFFEVTLNVAATGQPGAHRVVFVPWAPLP